MFNANRPTLDELPGTRQLLRSTLVAFVVAMLLLVTVVMPAEYAIDPTGAGRLLGLTQMGETKAQLAGEARADAAQAEAAAMPSAGASPDAASPAPAVAEPATTAGAPAAARQDEITVELVPGQGAEVKLEMKKGARVAFHWFVDGGLVNYDTHGDPYDAPKGFYHGYGKGKQVPEQKGELVADFDGKHGWFWRNRGDAPVKVTLRVSGDYIAMKRVI